MSRFFVLRRYPSYSIDGIDFERGIPVEVSDSLALRLKELSYFSELGRADCSLPEFPEISIGDSTMLPSVKNSIGADDDLNAKVVLLKRNGGIGDVVFIAAMASELQRRWPNCILRAAVRSELVEFVSSFDVFERVLTLSEAAKLPCVLQCDYIIPFDGVIETGKSPEGRLSDKLEDDTDYFALHFERAGLSRSDGESVSFEPLSVCEHLAGNRTVTEHADRILKTNGLQGEQYVVACLGSSNPLKRFSSVVLKRVCEGIASAGSDNKRFHVLCIGSPKDETFVSDNGWIHFARHQSIRLSAELIRRSMAVFGSDTGLVQFAAAIGVPTVAVFGPTLPKFSIKHFKNVATHSAELECLPCLRLRKSFCSQFSDGHALCMHRLNVDAIVADIKRMVSENHPAKKEPFLTTLDGEFPLNAASVKVAMLFDKGNRFTGGGFYLWQVAKLFASRAGLSVHVFTDTNDFVYANGDISVERNLFGDRLNVHAIDSFESLSLDPSFEAVIAQPVDLGLRAKTLAESIGAKCILTLYETPNYIAKYRSGADAEEAYWEDYKRALDSADLILCISRIVKEHLTTWIEHLKGARKAYVLNPPIDSITADSILQDANAPVDDLKQRENRIVLISRNVRYKAIKQTVEALIRLLPENALPVKIDVLGDACTKLIMPEREGVTVTLYENMGESDKWRLLSSARALIHPSEFEGFGIPVAEALYAGVPVFAKPLEVFTQTFKNAPFYYSDDEKMVNAVGLLLSKWKAGSTSLERSIRERKKVARLFTVSNLRGRLGSILKITAPELYAPIAKEPVLELQEKANLPTSTRIAFVTSWGNRCGIAETTRLWVDHLNCSYRIFAPYEDIDKGVLIYPDDARVKRSWPRKFTEHDRLLNSIVDYGPSIVHFQHEVSFFCKTPDEEQNFFTLIKRLRERGMKVIVTIHTFLPCAFVDRLRTEVDIVLVTKEQPDFSDIPAIHLPVEMPSRLGIDRARARFGLMDSPSHFVGSFGFWNSHKGFSEFLDTYDEVRSITEHDLRYQIIGYRLANNTYAQHAIRMNKERIDAGLYLIQGDYEPNDVVVSRLCTNNALVFNYSITGYYSASAAIRTGMSAGRPIVCTTSTMFNEFEDGKHVSKVEFGDKIALSRAIARLLTDKEYASSLVRNCDTYLRGCAPDLTAAKHEGLYANVLRGNDR